MSVERRAWDRMPDEPARAYFSFRQFRELGPLRTISQLADIGVAKVRTLQSWADAWSWWERAIAWDDECHMLDDRTRLEAIRTMHDTHQRAGRAAIAKGLAALQQLDPTEIPAYAAARLLELGTKLERDTLTVSVEELQGIGGTVAADDPWEAIARAISEPAD